MSTFMIIGVSFSLGTMVITVLNLFNFPLWDYFWHRTSLYPVLT
ncbi:MAG: hypothetical protein ACFFFH_18895 [Candidatus Thorarchaeota archaeon]